MFALGAPIEGRPMSDLWLWLAWLAVPIAVGLFNAGRVWGSEACRLGPARRGELLGEAAGGFAVAATAALVATIVLGGLVVVAGSLLGLWKVA